MTEEEQIKGMASIIASEQCARLPRGVRGLSYATIKAIAEQLYRQGYRKDVL